MQTWQTMRTLNTLLLAVKDSLGTQLHVFTSICYLSWNLNHCFFGWGRLEYVTALSFLSFSIILSLSTSSQRDCCWWLELSSMLALQTFQTSWAPRSWPAPHSWELYKTWGSVLNNIFNLVLGSLWPYTRWGRGRSTFHFLYKGKAPSRFQ